MDRLHELESLRRSLAMANPQSWALRREEAMALLDEVQETERRLRRLREGLKQLLEEEKS